MNTKTATKTPTPQAETQAPSERREVAVFQPPRLPYHNALKERFGIEPSGWKTLVEATYPSAKTIDSVVLALSYCKARNLDPFKKPVHIVPIWDSRANGGQGGYVESIWPGIAELRTTAFRTGTYAGCDEAEFGPMKEQTFTGKVREGRGQNAEWKTKEITVKFPEWCRVTVHRMLNGQRCKFVGPKVLWLESYATIGKSDLPNDMWQSRPEGQLEKCAEAASLRKAFPEELGSEYTADEMAGRHVIHDDSDATRTATPNAGPPSPDQVRNAQAAAEGAPQPDIIDVEAEEVEAMPADDPRPADNLDIRNQPFARKPQQASSQAQPTDGMTPDERDWINELSGAFSGCETQRQFVETQIKMMMDQKDKVSAFAWAKAQGLAEDTYNRVKGN